MTDKKLQFQLFTRMELEKAGEAFIWPSDGQMSIMPRECWQLILTNPEHREDLPVAGIALLGSKRVAVVALICRPLRWQKKEYTCLWDYNFYSDSTSRNYGAGGLLLRKILYLLKQKNILLASYGATPAANKVYTALRMHSAGRVNRYVLPLRITPIIRRFLLDHSVIDWLALPLDYCLQVGIKVISYIGGIKNTDNRFKFIVKENVGYDDFANKILDDSGPYLKRSQDMLNWMLHYARAIEGTEIVVMEMKDLDGVLHGYYIARIANYEQLGSQGFKNVRLFRVLDIVVQPDGNATQAMMNDIIKQAFAKKCDFIEMITSNPVIRKLSQKTGFITSNGYDLYFTAGISCLDSIEVNDWYLTMIEAEAAYY